MHNQGSKHLIFLTGLSGSGKSAVALHLSRASRCGLVDIDKEIERRTGKSIRDLFATDGERRFREIEADVIAIVIQAELARATGRTIIALGGGALMSQQNVAAVRNSGMLVYLSVRCQVAAQRLHNHSDRPLTLDEDGEPLSQEQLTARLETLLRLREPGYAQADFTIDTSSLSVEQVCQRIVKQVADSV